MTVSDVSSLSPPVHVRWGDAPDVWKDIVHHAFHAPGLPVVWEEASAQGGDASEHVPTVLIAQDPRASNGEEGQPQGAFNVPVLWLRDAAGSTAASPQLQGTLWCPGSDGSAQAMAVADLAFVPLTVSAWYAWTAVTSVLHCHRRLTHQLHDLMNQAGAVTSDAYTLGQYLDSLARAVSVLSALLDAHGSAEAKITLATVGQTLAIEAIVEEIPELRQDVQRTLADFRGACREITRSILETFSLPVFFSPSLSDMKGQHHDNIQ